MQHTTKSLSITLQYLWLFLLSITLLSCNVSQQSTAQIVTPQPPTSQTDISTATVTPITPSSVTSSSTPETPETPETSQGAPFVITTPTNFNTMPWWNDRVFYQIFVRSFYDSDGDGIGDIQGLISQLDYLNDNDPTTTTDLGINGIWLMPINQSPSYHGYDVTDYMTIDDEYGTLDDFKQLVKEAHRRNIKIIIDLVINHTSNQHPWFIESQIPNSPYQNWYIWQTEPPLEPPLSKTDVWHEANGRYYYGFFWHGMPDLNYNTPAVTGAMQNIMSFWLEKMEIDGFRLDAVKYLIEDGKIQEHTPLTHLRLQDFHRHAHTVNPESLLLGEVWSHTSDVAEYVGDELDLAFEFTLADAMFDAINRNNALALAPVQKQVSAAYPHGQYATFLSNHDQNRVVDQLPNDPGAAKVAATLLLTNPGVPFIYYGEEIGMSGTKPDEHIRTPMQWNDTPTTGGFTANTPWQPLSDEYQQINVAAQTDNPTSLLNHYRTLITLRHTHPALQRGLLFPVESDQKAVYSFIRYMPSETLLIVLNLSKKPVTDYTLNITEGPLFAVTQASLLLGSGDVVPPTVNNKGGFDGYTPVDGLEGRSSFIIKLQR